MKCSKEGCGNRTYWVCIACKKAVCPEHASVSREGDVFCSVECKKKRNKNYKEEEDENEYD